MLTLKKKYLKVILILRMQMSLRSLFRKHYLEGSLRDHRFRHNLLAKQKKAKTYLKTKMRLTLFNSL